MKKLLVIFGFLLITSIAQAQCVGEIKQVIQDPQRGSIIVETQYVLNGVVVGTDAKACPSCIGRVRYNESSGATTADIIIKAKADIKQHCENLIKRIASNTSFLSAEKLKQQKALTQPIIDAMQTEVGFKDTITGAVETYKGKDITVNADGSTSVIDTP